VCGTSLRCQHQLTRAEMLFPRSRGRRGQVLVRCIHRPIRSAGHCTPNLLRRLEELHGSLANEEFAGDLFVGQVVEKQASTPRSRRLMRLRCRVTCRPTVRERIDSTQRVNSSRGSQYPPPETWRAARHNSRCACGDRSADLSLRAATGETSWNRQTGQQHQQVQRALLGAKHTNKFKRSDRIAGIHDRQARVRSVRAPLYGWSIFSRPMARAYGCGNAVLVSPG